MSEEEKKTLPAEEDDLIRIPVMRHQSVPAEDYEKLKKKHRRLKIILVFAAVLCLMLGWLGGSIVPYAYAHSMQNSINAITGLDSSDKFSSILRVMSEEWFFAADIEDVSTRLTDQALYGMTTNEEDPHTSYMSSEEIESFTQSINRHFVGIGVQYIDAGDGMFLVERVFRSSPAEAAGVQAGDIIRFVNGESTENMTSEDISGRVRGEEGTKVSIGFERDGEIITLEITRAPINNTVYGEIMADGTGYLEIIQFGDTTAQEARGYLEDFRDRNVQELIIDLRGDGGGYLDSLRAVASLFIDDGPVIMKQVYSDGKVEELRSVEGLAFDFTPVVLLVDRNTASAAEVFTLAMKENRDDVTIIGETTYGKGTVQITRYFNDGSALKYTTSKWVSSQDVWVNGTGIEPDIAVANHEVIGTTYAEMPDEGSFSYDSVSEFVRFAQLGLDYLEYAPDRTDGYLSHGTENALRQFQQDAGLEATGVLDQKTYNTLISRIILDYNTNRDHDPQLQKALEVLHG